MADRSSRKISPASARSHTRKSNHRSTFHFPPGVARKIVLVALVGFLAYLYLAIQPPPPKICGSAEGPPVTAPRIKLRDGRHLAYKEHGVPREKAMYKIVFVHGIDSCRHDAVVANELSQDKRCFSSRPIGEASRPTRAFEHQASFQSIDWLVQSTDSINLISPGSEVLLQSIDWRRGDSQSVDWDHFLPKLAQIFDFSPSLRILVLTLIDLALYLKRTKRDQMASNYRRKRTKAIVKAGSNKSKTRLINVLAARLARVRRSFSRRKC